MKRVFKHKLDADVDTGQDAKVCLVGVSNNAYCIWIEDTPRLHGLRKFRIFGTGHGIPEDAKHVGSFQSEYFVWHVYELSE